MTYDPKIHKRRSIRLKGYDYRQAGLYFITICTHHRQHLFGRVSDGAMVLNSTGQSVEEIWHETMLHYFDTQPDAFIVMPNHFHCILNIAPKIAGDTEKGGVGEKGTINRAPTVGGIIRRFKARCSYAINRLNNTQGATLWQRNYYEHIIRDEKSCQRITDYIENNPAEWKQDIYYTQFLKNQEDVIQLQEGIDEFEKKINTD